MLSAAICLVVACACFAPAEARASCGDWLAGHEHEQALAKTGRDAAASPSAPAHKKPCSGPSCSRRSPVAPLAPVDSSSDRGIERWCSLPPGLPVDSFRIAGIPPTDEPSLPPARSRRLDRPPKDVHPGRS